VCFAPPQVASRQANKARRRAILVDGAHLGAATNVEGRRYPSSEEADPRFFLHAKKGYRLVAIDQTDFVEEALDVEEVYGLRRSLALLLGAETLRDALGEGPIEQDQAKHRCVDGGVILLKGSLEG